jgi:hypothetical protein
MASFIRELNCCDEAAHKMLNQITNETLPEDHTRPILKIGRCEDHSSSLNVCHRDKRQD